jgi:hypothetical protein
VGIDAGSRTVSDCSLANSALISVSLGHTRSADSVLSGDWQRSEVIIDACMLGGSESTFLQQAAHLTDGVYLRPKHRTALLQYLLVRTSPCKSCLCTSSYSLLFSASL